MKICKQCGQPMASDATEGLCARCLLSAAIKEPDVAATPTSPMLSAAPSPQPSASDFPDIGDIAEVASRLPQFEIISLLGRGGMGVVYQARQVNLDRIVALKILPPVDALTPDFVERFRREARSLAKLSHPNIVHVYDFGEAGGLYYFVMEFIDGVNLRDTMRSGKMTPAEALAVVPKICDALQFAHEEGVVHRDIKPENILMDKRGRVKIADFGLAKLLRREATDHTLTMSGMTLGTPRYMAPEQLDKPETVDHRADIYSLGVVFYEMLTGEVPMGRFAVPSQTVGVDVRLDEIVLRSLERDVERRYQHASEVRDDVEKVTSSPKVAQASPPVGPAGIPPAVAGTAGGTPADPTDWKSVPQPPAITTFLRAILWLAVLIGMVMFCWFEVVDNITAFDPKASFHTVRIGVITPWLILLDDTAGHSFYRLNLATVSALGGLCALVAGIALFCFRRRSVPDVRREVRRAAIGLLVSGVAGAVMAFAFSMMLINEGQWDKRLTGCIVGVALCVTFAVLAVFVFRGALRMLHCEDYAASRRAALCSIFSFNIVSLPIGIWALVRLSRPEVKALFATNSPEPRAPAPEVKPGVASDEPRLSKLALWGVIWAPFTLLGWPAWQMCLRQYFDNPAQFATYDPFYVTLGVTAAVLAATAGLGSMILGGVAIAQIRRSGGKLYGLPMAASALLFHPLLVLGFIATWLTNFIACTIVSETKAPVAASLDGPPPIAGVGVMNPGFEVLDLAVALTVCFFAGRAAWRKIAGEPAETKARPTAGVTSGPNYWVRIPLGVAGLALLWLALREIIGALVTLAASDSMPAEVAATIAETLAAFVCLLTLLMAWRALFCWESRNREGEQPFVWRCLLSVAGFGMMGLSVMGARALHRDETALRHATERADAVVTKTASGTVLRFETAGRTLDLPVEGSSMGWGSKVRLCFPPGQPEAARSLGNIQAGRLRNSVFLVAGMVPALAVVIRAARRKTAGRPTTPK